MKAKKVMSMMLACGMCLSLLAGCGEEKVTNESSGEQKVENTSSANESSDSKTEESNEESKEITFPLEEPITLTAYVCTGNEYLLEDSITMKKMEELTNVHWEFTYVPGTENSEKRGIILNSGDYPDVFLKSGLTADDLDTYGSEGIFIQLDDLITEYAPNFCKVMDERDSWSAIKSADGHVYSLCSASQVDYRTPVMYINEVWLENLGLSKPTNKDEFYNVLKAFKEQDADGDGDVNNEIPFITSNDLAAIDCIVPYFGVNYGGWYEAFAISDESDEMYFWPASETWKEALSYLNMLYEEGLLYSESFNTTIEQARALGLAGESLGCFFEWAPSLTVGSSYGENAEGKDAEYDVVDPFEDYKFPTSNGIGIGAYAITDACEYPEVALAWIDYFYSEEGGILADLGVEGVTYEVNEDGKWSWITDGEYGENPKNCATLWQGGGINLPMRTPDFSAYDAYIDPENIASVKTAAAKARIKENGDKYDIPWPSLTYTEEESERKATINADIEPYWKQYRAQVISGQIDLEESWDEYLEKLEAMGLEELEAIYNAAYDRTK